MHASVKRTIIKLSGDSQKETEDIIASEKRIRISINNKEIVSLHCTPLMIRELVVGMIMTEGIIKGEWCTDRMSIDYGDEINVDITAEDVSISEKKMIITSG